jgi:serine/threonine-protein kinase HipA
MTEAEMALVHVHLWGIHIGSVSWDRRRQLGHFTYSSQFRERGIEVAPVTMPLSRRTFSFPELNANVFKGLPGFLADSLPDRFGNAVIDAWLAREGRSDLTPVERLRLIGDRGMGALEYLPGLIPQSDSHAQSLNIAGLVSMINRIIASPGSDPVIDNGDARDLECLLQIGISADGARAKAVIAWDPTSDVIWPGHRQAPAGCGYWLLKFDGVTGNRDREAEDAQGYGLIEYAYHLMALEAGIQMSECRLLAENGRRHFVTRRFDRTSTGEKIHRQSLCALGHMDFDALGSYSYEQVMAIIQKLELPSDALKEQFRRMVFNVLARNHDDHPKNIAFLMDARGSWSLSPAYDLTFAYNPRGRWTNQHQMSLNGKRDNFTYADLRAVARRFAIADDLSASTIQQVADAVAQWPRFARRAGVDAETIDTIAKCFRLNIV